MNVLIDLYRNCAQQRNLQPLNDKEKEYIERARNGDNGAWIELYDYAWYTVITLWFGGNSPNSADDEKKKAFKQSIINALTPMLVYAESYRAYHKAEKRPPIGELCDEIRYKVVVDNLLEEKKYDLAKHNGIRAYYARRIPDWNAKYAESLLNGGRGGENSKLSTVSDGREEPGEKQEKVLELSKATPINICKAIVDKTGYVVRNLAETPNSLSQVGASPVDFCCALFLKLNERQENA